MTELSPTKTQYKLDGDSILFNQSSMPRMLFVLFHSLDVYVYMLKDWQYPYMVVMSESEFLSCLEMAKEL